MSAISDRASTRVTNSGLEVTVTEPEPESPVTSSAEEISGQLFGACIAAMGMFCVHIGLQLGIYPALAQGGPQTTSELSQRTGLDTRYLQEWLEQQAISGLLKAEGDDAATRKFEMADGVGEVLMAETSPFYRAPLAAVLPTVSDVLPKLENAFRTGKGVPYVDYGPRAVAIQGALNRPWFTHSLAQDWLPKLPDIEAKLKDRKTPARVADIGCGTGWAAIQLAKAYRGVRVAGIDDDQTSVVNARANAANEGVSDRVEFQIRDAARWSSDLLYDLVTFFESIHDMPHPAAALRNAREALAPGGAVLVMDEKAAEQFTAPGEDIERFFAAVSVAWCLPQSRVAADSAAIGRKIRPDTVRALAQEAGFKDVEILPIEHPVWRFYRMNP